MANLFLLATPIGNIQDEGNAQALIKELKRNYPTWDIRLLQATYDGAKYEVK